MCIVCICNRNCQETDYLLGNCAYSPEFGISTIRISERGGCATYVVCRVAYTVVYVGQRLVMTSVGRLSVIIYVLTKHNPCILSYFNHSLKVFYGIHIFALITCGQ